MSDCASICEILVSHRILMGLEIKKMAAWGNVEKNAIFLRLYPKGITQC